MKEGFWVPAALTAVRSPQTRQAFRMALDWKHTRFALFKLILKHSWDTQLKAHFYWMHKTETDGAFRPYLVFISSVMLHVTGELTMTDKMDEMEQYRVYGPKCRKNLQRSHLKNGGHFK